MRNPGDLAAIFGRVIAKATGNAGGTVPCAQLLTLLVQGGSGTLRGFRDVANITLHSEVQRFNTGLDSYVAMGVVQNGPANVA